jgi:hypothetical protein
MAGRSSAISPPDETTVFGFFGHGQILLERGMGDHPEGMHYQVPITRPISIQIPNNVIIVTFGNVCDTNTVILLREFQKLVTDKTVLDGGITPSSWLLDPIRYNEDILAYIKRGYSPATMQIERGDLRQSTSYFQGIPFTYTEEGSIPHQIFKSGLYDIKTLRTQPRSIYYPTYSETNKMKSEDLNIIFEGATLPTADNINDIKERIQSSTNGELKKIYTIFANTDFIVTLPKLYALADANPGKMYVFYFLACREQASRLALNALSSTRAALRSAATPAVVVGTNQARREERRRTEEAIAGGAGYGTPAPPASASDPLSCKRKGTCVMLGGSRKLKRKHKHRKHKNRRTRHKRRI